MSDFSHSTLRRSHKPLVYLVGAGPGDPGLLTLRGAQVLGWSQVVLYDGLTNESILAHAPQAQHICVGKHGQTRIWRQDEINDEMLRHAANGRVVVRLKGGDPAVFARTAEEIDTLRAAGIAFEVVPGITAALAASSYAGIPVTHRGLASAVALVTGHEEPGKSESALDWKALAQFPGTLVVYMGVTTAAVWTSALIEAGKSLDTPAAILRRCSLSDQQIVRCRLDEVASYLTPASKMRPPVIVIVGDVAKLADQGNWFSQRPLFGRRIMITRAEEQADELAEPLRNAGAEVILQPAISIEPSSDNHLLVHAIKHLTEYQWLVFTSRNGVDYFFAELFSAQRDVRSLAGIKIATVGPRTSERLMQFSLRADVTCDSGHSDMLVRQLLKILSPASKILWPCASRRSDALLTNLGLGGHHVSPVIAYEHRDVTQASEQNLTLMRNASVDWVTVTSSAIAQSIVSMFGQHLRHTRLASISPNTGETLSQLGFSATVEAESPSMEALITSIIDFESQSIPTLQ